MGQEYICFILMPRFCFLRDKSETDKALVLARTFDSICVSSFFVYSSRPSAFFYKQFGKTCMKVDIKSLLYSDDFCDLLVRAVALLSSSTVGRSRGSLRKTF
jgi:hypothetical protein